MDEKSYTIDQLSELSGYSRRTIRYYVQQGLLEPPAGRGRGGFYYDSHLQRLREIRARQEQGIKLSAIQELSEHEVTEIPESGREIWIRYPVTPGLEIHIRRDVEENAGRRITEIVRVVKSLIRGGIDE